MLDGGGKIENVVHQTYAGQLQGSYRRYTGDGGMMCVAMRVKRVAARARGARGGHGYGQRASWRRTVPAGAVVGPSVRDAREPVPAI